MKIRKTKKLYKTMFLAPHYCTKVKFKKIGTLIKTLCGVFVIYEVRRWYRKMELTTRHVSIRAARRKQFQ
jgi:hypothetical protein